ncbi:MAG: DUF1156 domain-containing protein, partial [bacterium]
MTVDRKLIEYNLPLADISDASAREKYIRHGHPSTLHIWWARRPLASSRATAFAALIDDPGEDHPKQRERLMELIKEITPWEAVKDGNSEAVEQARELVLQQYEEKYGRPPRVLDPFAGGGSIPLEALRLGCETYASDYNPVAVFIEKATLEWPQKFGIEVELPREMVSADYADCTDGEDKPADQGTLWDEEDTVKVNLLAYLVEKWANIILEEAREEIGQFYPAESADDLVGKRELREEKGWIPIDYLWARTIPCQNPTCGAEIPLIKQFWLARKKDKHIAYRPVVDEASGRVRFELLENAEAIEAAEFDPSDGTVTRGDARCPVCGQVTPVEQVRRMAYEGAMDQRMVVVVFYHFDQYGKRYRIATQQDKQVYAKASARLKQELAHWPYLESPLPEEQLPPAGTLGFRIQRYGMTQWQDLFNARQKLGLVTFLERIRASYQRVQIDCEAILAHACRHKGADGGGACTSAVDVGGGELTQAVMGYVALVLSRTAEFTSTLTRWKPDAECPVNVYARQALPMMWDYAENNPLSGMSGSWAAMYERMLYGSKENFQESWVRHGIVKKSSAANLPFSSGYFDCVLTDPPYYDNVPYAALSDFFYVWLKRSVGEHFPELFATPVVAKAGEAVMEPARHESRREAKAFFEQLLAESFCEIERVLEPGGTAVIVYAHKTTAGWETMLNSLVDASLVVTGSWPVHTEMKSRLRATASAALASSIYMVCRKMDREPLGFWNELQPRIKEQVEEKLALFWREGIAGG